MMPKDPRNPGASVGARKYAARLSVLMSATSNMELIGKDAIAEPGAVCTAKYPLQ
jgi:hypothetical protein